MDPTSHGGSIDSPHSGTAHQGPDPLLYTAPQTVGAVCSAEKLLAERQAGLWGGALEYWRGSGQNQDCSQVQNVLHRKPTLLKPKHKEADPTSIFQLLGKPDSFSTGQEKGRDSPMSHLVLECGQRSFEKVRQVEGALEGRSFTDQSPPSDARTGASVSTQVR